MPVRGRPLPAKFWRTITTLYTQTTTNSSSMRSSISMPKAVRSITGQTDFWVRRQEEQRQNLHFRRSWQLSQLQSRQRVRSKRRSWDWQQNFLLQENLHLIQQRDTKSKAINEIYSTEAIPFDTLSWVGTLFDCQLRWILPRLYTWTKRAVW